MPDRSAYRSSCLFCRIVSGELPSTKLHEDDLVIAIRDIAPEAPTPKVLVTPLESGPPRGWAVITGSGIGASVVQPVPDNR